MREIARRSLLAAAGGLSLAPGLSVAGAADTEAYDLLSVEVRAPPGPELQKTRAAYLDLVRQETANVSGARLVAALGAQIGWKANACAVLVGWSGPRGAGALRRMTTAPQLANCTVDHLNATARPKPGDRSLQGGVYTLRWFVVAPRDVEEVVRLSTQAWVDFEGGFDSEIFGLFTAERTAADRREGVSRMLLMTHYKNLATWEASREPSPAAQAAFAKRRLLTRATWVVSTTPL